MTAIGRPALAAIFSLTLAGWSGGAAPAATTGSAPKPGATAPQAAPTDSPASAALIVGALEPKPFSGLAGSISAIRFSPDGRTLAAGGQDLWDVATWKAVPITTALNQGVLDAFAFSPDSQLLAGIATGQDHIVHVWPLQPAAATAAAPAPAGPVPAVSRPTGPGPAGFDACTLVTKAEAEAMLGAPVVATDNRPTACRYHAADGSGVTDIPGLGDKAYSSGDDPYCCALYVLKGSRLFEIVVTPFDRSFDQGARRPGC